MKTTIEIDDSTNDRDSLINSRISYLQSNVYRLRLGKSKLKAVTRTSTLLSGFAMIAMVELNIDFTQNNSTINEQNQKFNVTTIDNLSETTNKIPSWLLIIYALVTCLLVSTHMLALMISTCVLSQVEAEKFDLKDLSNVDYTFSKKDDDLLLQSPERTFHWYIEFAWISSIVIGLFLFLIEIALICFIKFYPLHKYSAYAGLLTMLPFVCIFLLFTCQFYRRIIRFKLNSSKVYLKELKLDLV